jgi:hypothetical protein
MCRRNLLALFLISISVSPALAQFGRQGHGQAEGLKDAQAEGTIHMVAGPMIRLTSNANQMVTVRILPQTEVSFKGTASADFLRQGLSVEFVADVDETGKAKEPVATLSVITTGPGRQAGLFGEGAMGSKKVADPGILSDDSNGKTKKGHKSKAKKAPAGGDDLLGSTKSTASNVKLPAVCTVRGKVKSFKNNTITVLAGRKSIKAEIADGVQIDVDMSDCTAASSGDKIKLWGKTLGSQPIIYAEKVEIEAAQALTGQKTKSGKGKERPTKGEKPAKAGKAAKAEKAEKADDVLGGGK